MNTKLTLHDIADLRAYEREREEFRARIIELKRRRRVPLGLFVTLLFENRETIRFQIQEMARAEKLITDEQIETELDVYNPLIPAPGQLSATLFIELTSKDQLMEWLPKLVGIERSIELHVGDQIVRCIPEESHEAQLTREEVTASVHYLRFEFSPQQVEAFEAAVAAAGDDPAPERTGTDTSTGTGTGTGTANGIDDSLATRSPADVRLVCTHPAYREETVLATATKAELLADLRGTSGS